MSHKNYENIRFDAVQIQMHSSNDIGNIGNWWPALIPAKILNYIASTKKKSCIKCNKNCTYGHKRALTLIGDQTDTSFSPFEVKRCRFFLLLNHLFYQYTLMLPHAFGFYTNCVWRNKKQLICTMVAVQSTYRTRKSIGGKWKSSWIKYTLPSTWTNDISIIFESSDTDFAVKRELENEWARILGNNFQTKFPVASKTFPIEIIH